MTPDLTDNDKAALIEPQRETIERDRFPMSPRIRSFKALNPSAPQPMPPPKPPGERSVVLGKKRRR